MAKRKLLPWTVYDLHYQCRLMQSDYDPEAGDMLAYWTGEIDTWGKYTWVSVVHGAIYYLFRDEIVSFATPTLD